MMKSEWILYTSDNNNRIVKSEKYLNQSRITIYSPGDFSKYEIVCGIYGLMFHTVFADSLDEANTKYEQMKQDIQTFIDNDFNEDDFFCNFIEKW